MSITSLQKPVRSLRHDAGGVGVIEFAYVLPIFLLFGMMGVELAYFGIANMRVSQIAMTVADNISRAKDGVRLTQPRLREVDINDNLLGARVQGGESLKILDEGRIIVSSLQRNAANRQTITWQRCKGKLNVSSRYGVEGATEPSSGTGGFQGMGTGSSRVRAEPNSAIIFAEVAYSYKPLFSETIFGPQQIRREAAFFVRDDRNLTQVFNDAPGASVSSCNKFDVEF